jgi:SAM-dependent methyltransferase
MSALLEAYPPRGPVLDVGCGSGDLALAVAARGLQVTGIDFIPAAIAHAQAKAANLPPEIAPLVTFQIADALYPSRLQRHFGTVLDSGFLHVLESDQRTRFIDELAMTLGPGGRYYLLAFAVEFAIPNTPRLVSAEEVRTRFRAEHGWQIHGIHEAVFHSRVAPPVPALSACIEYRPVDRQGGR